MWWALAQQGAQTGLSLLEARKQKDVQEAAFRIRQQEGASKIQAIEYERERLADSQRGIKAEQRMSVASRGGLMGGTDLLTLAEEAKNMQMDQLEMVRQRDMEEIRMANEKALQDYQQNYTKNMIKGWTSKLGSGVKDWSRALTGDYYSS